MILKHSPVLFVGADPGDPDLITVKGRNALKQADVIIFAGSLVPKKLEKFSINFKTIPGVTAAFAAAANMNMEYTLPEVSQTLILTRISGRTPVPDLEDLGKLCSHKSSIVIYLSIGHIKRVEKILSTAYGDKSLCAIAHKIGFKEEKIIYCNADKITWNVKKEQIKSQAIILAGKAIEASVTNKEIIKSKLYDITFSHEYREKK